MIRPLFAIYFLVFFPSLIWGQVQVAAELDTTKITIGDQVRLRVSVQHQPEVSINNVDYSGIEELETVEILAVEPAYKQEASDQVSWYQELTITSFDSGYHWIPKIPVHFLEEGKPKTLQTNELPLEVNTFPPADSIQLQPIKGIIAERLSFQDFVPFLLILAALAVFGFFLWYARLPKKVEAHVESVEERPAHEVALEKLEQLKAQGLWQRGEVKRYQTELTYIVREYLEGRFGMLALESTSEEIIQQLRDQEVELNWINNLQKMFQTADLVKFAKVIPPADVHHQMWEEARDFIRTTKKVETALEEEKTNLT